jgi:hypothetical protein
MTATWLPPARVPADPPPADPPPADPPPDGPTGPGGRGGRGEASEAAAAPSAAVQPMAVLAARYGRAFDIAVVVIVAGWQVAGAGSQLVPDRALFGSFAFQCAAWLALTAAIAAGSVRLLRGLTGPRWTWALAGVALAVSTAAALGCPAGDLLRADWAWGTAGWVGVLVLLRRPLAEVTGFLAVEALATFAVLAHDGLHRAGLAGFITILAQAAAIQLVVAGAARALGSTAREAAQAAQGEAAAREQEVIAGQLRGDRLARWGALHESAGPLLRGLAAGTSDPGDPDIRRACAIEAARLRRLMAESDDSPGPLVHELHACADVAEKRGVAVDIETVGTLPGVPAPVRRVITDTAIAILTTARSQARVTLTALAEGVAVSLVADCPEGPPLPPAADGMVLEQQRDRHNLWVEARWTRW